MRAGHSDAQKLSLWCTVSLLTTLKVVARMHGFVLPTYRTIRTISSDVEWARTIAAEIYARQEIGSWFAARVNELVRTLPESDISRVRLALDGRFPSSELSEGERDLFFDFLPWVGPHPDSEWFGDPIYEKDDSIGP